MKFRYYCVFILLLLAYQSFGQSDSTIYLPVISYKIENSKRNVVSLELTYTLQPLFANGKGLGLNYERLIRGRRSFISTIKAAETYNESVGRSSQINYYYANIGYRFYLNRIPLGRIKYDGETYFVQKRSKLIHQPNGFYIGALILFDSKTSESIHYNPITHEHIESFYAYNITFGIGSIIGYQWIIAKLVTVNIDLPFGYGIHTYNSDYGIHKDNGISYYSEPMGMVNFSIGFTF